MADQEVVELTAEETAVQQQMEQGETTDVTPTVKSGTEAVETPEQKAAAEATATQQKAVPEKTVPLAALHEARMEIKQLRQRMGAVDELKQQIIAMRQENTQRQQVSEPQIDKVMQPTEYAIHKLEQIERANKEMQERYTQDRQQTAQLQERQQFVSHVKILEDDFRKNTPDYDKAFTFLQDSRRKELEQFGVAEEVIERDLMNSAYGASIMALQNGKNPAQVIYALAQSRGYKGAPPVKQATQQNVEQQLGLGEHLETIQKGQQNASTRLGGAETEKNTDVNALLAAEGEDFDQLWQKMFGKAK